MTEPGPHPLTAIRRTAVVTGTLNVPTTLTVNIGGDTTDVELPYLASYEWPAVGDLVVVLGILGDSVVLGPPTAWTDATAGAPDSPGGFTHGGYYRHATFSAVTAPSGVTTAIPSLTTVKEVRTLKSTPWASSTFTVQPGQAGVYSAHFHADNILSTTGRSSLFIQVNGVTKARSVQGTSGGLSLDLSTALVGYWLNETDQLSFAMLQFSGADLTTGGTVTVKRE